MTLAASLSLDQISSGLNSVIMWPMAILVALAILSGSTVAYNTGVNTCCPPGQFLAIEDWQESRQTVEGIWFSQNPAGIIP